MDAQLAQRRAALLRANEARFYRARLKKRMKARELSWEEVESLILNPPAPLERMPVAQFLLALPCVGVVKADKVLRKMRLNSGVPFADLSEGQRKELASLVSTWQRYLL